MKGVVQESRLRITKVGYLYTLVGSHTQCDEHRVHANGEIIRNDLLALHDGAQLVYARIGMNAL